MRLEQFDPATGAAEVRACHEIYLAGQPIDDPYGPPFSERVFAGWLTMGWTEDRQEVWLARDSRGEPRGWYQLGLPQRDNQHLARVTPTVHPAHRRQGLGTELLRHAAGRARESGRTVLSGYARDGAPGSAFASALGARPGLSHVGRVLRLPGLPAGRLATLRAQAEPHATGYALLSWAGPAPDDLVAGLAEINASAWADMPRNAGEEAQRWDEARVRLDEQRIEAQGLRWYTVAARSLASGELAAFTQLALDPAGPSWGYQELTAVGRPHRGHRLGLLVKVAMLELLAEREPQLTQIATGNADANQHMIAINAQLGFEVVDAWPYWELDLQRALTARSHAVSVTS
jgi:GNAT superfamily N-acetyltransferase/RimJ/RimL family protein N-acetyltransferase